MAYGGMLYVHLNHVLHVVKCGILPHSIRHVFEFIEQVLQRFADLLQK